MVMKSFTQRRLTRFTMRGLLLALLCSIMLVGVLPAAAQSAPQQELSLQWQWQHVPIVPKDALQAGYYPGGEGGQWIRNIRWSLADPNFLLMTTDVGGIYRSLDGGNDWQVAMVGWLARGGNDFAFDPRNPNRVIGVAGNGSDDPNTPNGLYLSTNKAASWKQVLPDGAGPWDGANTSIAFDPTSYNEQLGYCTIAYFVSRDHGIYKSTDGGETWKQINSQFSNVWLRVHPTKGYLYIASDHDPKDPNTKTPAGFYKSIDGGLTFTQTDTSIEYGIDVSPAAPDKVWISQHDQVLVSDDAGNTFHPLAGKGLPDCCTQPLLNITVSPANANYMSVWWPGDNWNWERLYSTDGGQSWGISDYGHYNDNFRQTKYVLLPYNVRDGRWAYSPVDPKVIISNGGDWITKSTDGGAHYLYNGNGENAIFVPSFNFNPNNPNNILIASKDYNSYASTDGGRSFTYAQTGFDFGGYGFGGFALDSKVMWLGNDKRYDSAGDAFLEESTDGGQTWFYPQYNGQDIDLANNGTKWDLISYSDPTNNDIGFIGGWRTTDHGQTWSPMTNVEDVYTSNPGGKHELYGKSGEDIVVSYDHGVTWQKVTTVPGGFRELAYDQVHHRFWIASATLINGQYDLKKYENGQLSTVDVPKDQYGGVRIAAVAVDPGNPNIVYAGDDANIWAATNSIMRSTDGGKTWKNLTVERPLVQTGSVFVSSGPHEVWWIEVNPKTHEAWVSTNCFGIWKIAPPGKGE